MPYKNPNLQCEASKLMEKDFDKIYDLYHNEKMSMHELADMYETNIGVVQYFFSVYDIESRHHTERPRFKTKKTKHIWENRETIKKMYVDDKMSTMDLGLHFNISSQTIMGMLKEMDVEIRGYTGKKTQKAWTFSKEIIRLYRDKKFSRVKLGKRYGCSHKTIEKILIENGIPLRKSSMKSEVIIARTNVYYIKKLYMSKERSLKEIAADFNVSVPTISKILSENGVVFSNETI